MRALKLGGLFGAFLLSSVALALPAQAQVDNPAVSMPTVRDHQGRVIEATPSVCLQPNGTACSSGGGAGGSITGNVGGYSAQIADLLSVSTSAHALGSSLGGLQTISLARTAGGSGTLTNLRFRSTAGATPTLWVYAWSKQPSSTCNDGSAFSGSVADVPYAIPGFPQSVTLTSPGTWDTSSYAQLLGVNAQFKNQDTTPGTNIYVCVVVGAALTPASATDFSIVLNGLQD